MNVVNRLTVFFNGHFGKVVYSEDDIIAFLKPFIGREEAVLQLTILLYQNGEESTSDVERIMNAFPKGKEDEMHRFVQIQLDNKKHAAQPSTSTAITTTAAANAHVPTAITTTTTIGAPTFWGAEAGTAVVPDGLDDDDLSMTGSLFDTKRQVEDDAHTIPEDIQEDIEDDRSLEEHNKLIRHAKDRVEADHEKETSVKEKTGNKLSRISRQTSKRKELEN
jgi:hypothetical protein